MKQTVFKYDIHVHSKEGSPCGKDSAVDIARAYAKGGYDGFVLTDHFGRYLLDLFDSYREAIDNQYRAYCLAREEGERLGLRVFFGIEYRHGVYDFLTFGIDRDFLLRNEDIFEIPFEEYAARVHEVGGLIIQAHPFRKVGRHPLMIQNSYVDAIEIYNGSHVPYHSPYPAVYNDLAAHYAEVMGLIGTAGSDTHDVDKRDGTPFRHASMLFEEKIDSVEMLMAKIRGRQFVIEKE